MHRTGETKLRCNMRGQSRKTLDSFTDKLLGGGWREQQTGPGLGRSRDNGREIQIITVLTKSKNLKRHKFALSGQD